MRLVLSVVVSNSLDVISAVLCVTVALEKADEATSNDKIVAFLLLPSPWLTPPHIVRHLKPIILWPIVYATDKLFNSFLSPTMPLCICLSLCCSPTPDNLHNFVL